MSLWIGSYRKLMGAVLIYTLFVARAGDLSPTHAQYANCKRRGSQKHDIKQHVRGTRTETHVTTYFHNLAYQYIERKDTLSNKPRGTLSPKKRMERIAKASSRIDRYGKSGESESVRPGSFG